MQTIRCSQCGMINQPDDIGFPRCGQCHDDLVRCVYCRHHTTGCTHPQGAAQYTADGEAAKRCTFFHARTAVRGPRWRLAVPAPIWVALFLLVVLLGLASAAWFIDPLGRYIYGNPLRLETAVPAQVTVGEPFTVTMRVTNLLQQASTRIYVEIDEDFLALADPGLPFPAPERISRYRHGLLLEYDPLPAGGQMQIKLPYTARRAGQVPFSARLYAPNNQMRHQVTVPIDVIAGLLTG